MSLLTSDKVTTEANASTRGPSAEPRESNLHRGPVARLLAKVSHWAGEYSEYQFENCSSRRMVL